MNKILASIFMSLCVFLALNVCAQVNIHVEYSGGALTKPVSVEGAQVCVFTLDTKGKPEKPCDCKNKKCEPSHCGKTDKEGNATIKELKKNTKYEVWLDPKCNPSVAGQNCGEQNKTNKKEKVTCNLDDSGKPEKKEFTTDDKGSFNDLITLNSPKPTEEKPEKEKKKKE